LLTTLSDILLSEAAEHPSSGTILLYYAVAIREWAFGTKPGSELKRASMRSDDMIILARRHFELWQRLGVFAENYHLHRSKELFSQYFETHPNYDNASDLIIYCKLLQHLGEMEEAAAVIEQVLVNNENDADYPNYLFFAGAIYKSLNQHEKANNYFFEASQSGPPKFFSKLEMMAIISRLIEEYQGEENADDDAYRMVSRR
jgi:tetratricopeptide (TPR) repeat protein